MPVEDAEMTRLVRREISRRYVDCTHLEVRVMHGVVYLRGWIERLRSQEHKNIDLTEELQVIQRILLQKSGVREVVMEIDAPKARPASMGQPGRRT
jgi:hypothetical protein